MRKAERPARRMRLLSERRHRLGEGEFSNPIMQQGGGSNNSERQRSVIGQVSDA